jgi:hypothetical protein
VKPGLYRHRRKTKTAFFAYLAFRAFIKGDLPQGAAYAGFVQSRESPFGKKAAVGGKYPPRFRTSPNIGSSFRLSDHEILR